LNQIVPFDNSNPDSLLQLDRLRQEIEAAQSIPDVKDLRDKAEAIRHYLQQADQSLAVLNAVAELKIRAERRAGQLLLDMGKNQGGKPIANASHDARGYDSAENNAQTLADLGITYSQSSRWQQIAALPDPTFETYVEDVQTAGRELTTSGLLAYARRWHRSRTSPRTDRARCHDWKWPEDSPYQIYCRDLAEALPTLPPASVRLIFARPSQTVHLRLLAEEAPRLLCPGGSLLLFVGQDNLFEAHGLFSARLQYQWMICSMADSESEANGRGVQQQWQPILWFVRGAYVGGALPDVLYNEDDEFFDEDDPDTNSLSTILEAITQPGDVILDPCLSASRGALAAAVLQYERRLIGYDPSAAFVKKLAARLDKWLPRRENLWSE
jgi:hypothetical protein